MLDRNAVLALVRDRTDPAVTITMPTFRRMPEAQQNPIRFKNLLAQARERLGEAAIREGPMAERLADAEAMIDDYEFWQNQRDGLAVFISPKTVRTEPVERELPETVHVGAGYAIKPLLGLLAPGPEHYILAAAWEDVRLYKATPEGVDSVRDQDLPKSIKALIGMSEVEGNVHFHPTGPASTTGGTPSAKFHSLGTAPSEELEKIQQNFARALAKEVDSLLRAEPKMRLVLIADERLSGMIGQHVRTGLVRSPQTQVSPAELSAEEIGEIAAKAMRVQRGGDGGGNLETVRAHLNDQGSDLASTDARAIARAAVMGRVAELFLDPRRSLSGTVDETTGDIVAADGEGDVTEDLVRLTLRNGGDVRVIEGQDFDVAALYRF